LRDYRTGSADELGAEGTPEEYVGRLVAIFRELRRVLRDDGTFWLNLGDTYSGGGGGNYGTGMNARYSDGTAYATNATSGSGLSPGNLVGIPWRVALAMQADGWILRQEVIWAKPDCMPESVTNRCSRAHEHIFLFAKGTDYFYDSYATRERSLQAGKVSHGSKKEKRSQSARARGARPNSMWIADEPVPEWRNKRDVWTVAHGAGYGGNHFAVYPPELITPCILAGTSAHGCCPECAAPWRRILEKVRVATRPGVDSKVWKNSKPPGRKDPAPGKSNERDARERLAGEVTGNRDPARHVTEVRVLGWYPTCKCDGLPELKPAPPLVRDYRARAMASGTIKERGHCGEREHSGDYTPVGPTLEGPYDEWVAGVRQECARAAEVRPPEELVPAVVLDPFIGSGTTALVCVEHGRRCVGVDLSEQHLQNDAIARIGGDLGGRPALRHLVPGRK
jgi:DNA modification methylase